MLPAGTPRHAAPNEGYVVAVDDEIAASHLLHPPNHSSVPDRIAYRRERPEVFGRVVFDRTFQSKTLA